MLNINTTGIEPADVSGGSGFTKLPAGGYIVKIVDVEHNEGGQYVWLVFDIAEGEHAGYYSDAFNIQRPYTHRVMMKYSTDESNEERHRTITGMLLGRCAVIDACNPGFDSFAAFNAEKWDMFNGKRIGLVVGDEEYQASNGDIRTRLDWFHAKWRSTDDIAAGNFKVPALKKVDRGIDVPAVPERGTAVYDDIPFV